MKKHHPKIVNFFKEGESKPIPEEDGITHINAHPTSKIELGKLLSQWAHTPFIHPFYGPFTSIEGFWYWLRSSVRDDKLRYLSGKHAKGYGKVLPKNFYPEFWEDIHAAVWQKIIQNTNISQMLLDTTLPIRQYYVEDRAIENGGVVVTKRIIIGPRDYDKYIEGIEEARSALREDRPNVYWEKAAARIVARETGAQSQP